MSEIEDYPESTQPHLDEIKKLYFEENKSEEEIATKLSIDELDIMDAVLMLEMDSDDDSDDNNSIDHEDSNDEDDKKIESELDSNHNISIKGFGNEFQIGFVSDDEIQSICEDENDINEVIEELSERNDFLQIYGPDIEDCTFYDKSGTELDLPKEWDDERLITEDGLSIAVSVINMEACTNYKNDFMERIEELVSDKDNLHSKIPYFDIEKDGSNIKKKITDEFNNLFIEKPTNEKFLIQKHIEKGDWGTLEINNNVNSIVILALEIEGYTKTLLGFFYYDNNQIEFKRYSTDDIETEGTRDSYEIYNAVNYETIWEG